MLKYYDYAITFTEYPDEISLCVNISNCPCHCPDCHSKYLWNDVGTPLTNEEIDRLIQSNPHATVFGIMGGDADHDDVIRIAQYIHEHYRNVRVGMYSGLDTFDINLLQNLDYYKFGHYDSSRGPLNNPETNQIIIKNVTKDLQKK